MATSYLTFPDWVVPPGRQVADCLYLAHASVQNGGRPAIAAVAASVNWVTGGQLAPLTERADAPTEPVARAEWMLAYAPMEPGIWRDLGVTPAEPVTDDQGWRNGVSLTLGWLLGAHPRPPLELPRRNPDGALMTADQLYQEERAANPHRTWMPEQRHEARTRAEVTAIRSQRLAELIASVA